MLLRPFFTFYGGKWRAAPHYPPPEHNTIVEPFAGSAGYSLRYPHKQVVLVEKDPVIAQTWRYLIGVSAEEVLGLPDISEGQDVRDLPICPEAQSLIGWWLTRGATAPNRTLSAWGRDSRYQRQFWGAAARARIASQAEHIRHWIVLEDNYDAVVGSNITWFIDPPYAKAGKHYRYGRDQIDYDALGQWCRQRDGQVIVCENTGADWIPFEHFRNVKANESRTGGKISQEAIWVRTS